ncbi:hypothetical protein [Paucisalibacillus globulus]|uniref:hypothetical protein n=1 Tax=Paucisalibacillus globulus TaxID=351095 RepID=UPI000BB90F1F|nr:hypothetical protein [Paucisalibacillus globulus]
MKSWITFLIPNDEYKEKRILYLLAEGGILLFLSLIVMVIWNQYFLMNTNTALLILVTIFLFYVTARYTLSGIEYTDVATESSYKKELKHIRTKTISFVLIFIVLFLFISGVPANKTEWVEIGGLLISVGFLWYLTSFISLKRSYKKNKELL